MKLRYTGSSPTTLLLPGREVEPFEEFEVTDEAGAAFAGRPDFEWLDAPAVPDAADGEPDQDAGGSQETPATGRRKTKTAGVAAEAHDTDVTEPTA